MKRIIAWVLVFLCITTFSCASAEQAIKITCSFSDWQGDHQAHFDFFRDERGTWIRTPFLPQEIFLIPDNTGCKAFLDTNAFHDTKRRDSIISATKEIFHSWLSRLNYGDPVTGIYHGDLFDYAETEQIAAFSAEDLHTLIRRLQQENENRLHGFFKENAISDSIVKALDHALGKIYENQPVCFICKSYDDGRYYSFHMLQDNDVIMTLSTDFSENGKAVFLTRNAEDGKIYSRRLQLSFSDDIISVSSVLTASDKNVSDADKPGKLISSTNLYIEKRPPAANNEWQFGATLLNGNSETLMDISGTIIPDAQGNAAISGVCEFPTNGSHISWQIDTDESQQPDSARPEKATQINETIQETFSYIRNEKQFVSYIDSLIQSLPSPFSLMMAEYILTL